MKRNAGFGRILICLMFVACFCVTPLFATGRSDTGSGVTTIRVWSDNASDRVVREQQVARYNAGEGRQKGIQIEYTVYGANYNDLIRNAVLADTAPEVFRSSGENITQFQAAGKLMALEDLPGGPQMIALYSPSDLQKNLQVFGGKTYSLPYSMTTFKLIINKTMFDAAGITEAQYPRTWADVRALARRLTNPAQGQYGYITGLQSPWVMRSYLTMPNSQNVGHTGFNNATLQFEFSRHIAAIEAVYGIVQDGSIFPGFEGLDADMIRARFAEGNIGMIMGASFDCGVYNTQFPAKMDWLPIDPPTESAGAPPYRAFVDASNLLTIGNAARRNADKAMDVFKFFYSDENLAELYVEGLYVPFRQEALRLARSEPVAKGFKEFASVPNPAIGPATPENRIQVEGLAYRETFQRIFSRGYGDQTVAQILADLDRRYNDAVGRLSRDVQEEFRATVDFRRR